MEVFGRQFAFYPRPASPDSKGRLLNNPETFPDVLSVRDEFRVIAKSGSSRKEKSSPQSNASRSILLQPKLLPYSDQHIIGDSVSDGKFFETWLSGGIKDGLALNTLTVIRGIKI